MNLRPLEDNFWKGLGNNFNNFPDIICEILDNSKANMLANNIINASIIITITEKESYVIVSIEDCGTGIKCLEAALTAGNKTFQQSTLNEHGFGINNALGAADETNRNWSICTRTEDEVKKSIYRKVKAPYTFDMKFETLDSNWPGKFTSSGTFIEFKTSKDLFFTLRKGNSSNAKFARCIDYLAEELGYRYATPLSASELLITLIINPNSSIKITPIIPKWNGYYEPKTGSTKLDLGNGEINVHYSFGEMGIANSINHYKRNPASCGCEIRINGRLLSRNILSEIWGVENHPHFNHFLVLIDLISPYRERLPSTKINKSGIKLGDTKLEKLYDWIRCVLPTIPRMMSDSVFENDLLDKLEELKRAHLTGKTSSCTRQFLVYTKIQCPVKIDMYIFDGSQIWLYEAKKDNAEPKDLYQLLMYWDGAVSDGLTPGTGVLIASTFSPGLKSLVKQTNTRTDANGNNYNIILQTWQSQCIQYPKTPKNI